MKYSKSSQKKSKKHFDEFNHRTPDIRDYLFEKIIVVPLIQINEKKKKIPKIS